MEGNEVHEVQANPIGRALIGRLAAIVRGHVDGRRVNALGHLHLDGALGHRVRQNALVTIRDAQTLGHLSVDPDAVEAVGLRDVHQRLAVGGLRMRVDGQEGWYPLVTWGTHWYEADGQWEVLLEDASDIEILVESLVDEEVQVEKVSLEGLPKRTDYSLRLQVEAMFLDERTCKLTFRDVGFGEFFTPTDFRVEKTIQLGGINGQFNSMS